jgi:hypothetical protein
VISGGNRELTDSIREIVLQTRQQFGDFANAGEVNWLNYISGMQYEHIGSKNQAEEYLMKNNIYCEGKSNLKKAAPIKMKLDEIQILLNSIEHGFHSSRSAALEPEFKSEISYQLEKLFADEVTALYYFHLYYDYEFNGLISKPTKFYSSDRSTNKFPISSRPKECLLSILQKDQGKPRIVNWFHRWMQDIRDLQKDIYCLLDDQTNMLYVSPA